MNACRAMSILKCVSGLWCHWPAGPSQPHSLPPPLAAMQQTTSRPAFLDPEATRPLANSLHKTRPSLATSNPPVPHSAALFSEKGAVKGADWDIARMAPPLKGQARAGGAGPQSQSAAVISAGPKRSKPADDSSEGIVTAAQIAMLGGQWRPSEDQSPPGTLEGDEKAGKRKATQAMGVNEFMEKGLGGAALPRARQERKDREKLKRQKGQSAIGSWKTEAEMVLRQQYDT